MEKLTVHESLRIYLPGLFLTLASNFLITGTVNDITSILFLALFVGLIVDQIFYTSYIDHFKYIANTVPFPVVEGGSFLINDAIKTVISAQLKSKAEYQSDNKKKFEDAKGRWDTLTINDIPTYNRMLHARLSSSEKLTFFRLAKSFGILYFNVSKICFFLFYISIFKIICIFSISCFGYLFYDYNFNLYTGSDYIINILIIVIFRVLGFLLMEYSDVYFKNSYRYELSFSSSLSDDDLHIMADLVLSYRQPNKNSTQ